MALYASGVEMQELNISLDVIHKEITALIKDVQMELDRAGYTLELVEKVDAVLDSDTIAGVIQKNLDFALKQEELCTSVLNEVAVLYDTYRPLTYEEFEIKHFEDIPEAEQESAAIVFFDDHKNIEQYNLYCRQWEEKYSGLFNIIDNVKGNANVRLESIGIIKEGVGELQSLDNRDAQDQCIDKIECAHKRIYFAANAYENLRDSFRHVNDELHGSLKAEFDKDPRGFISRFKEDFPKLNELSDIQVDYIASSKYISNMSVMLRDSARLGEFVDLIHGRGNALSLCASKDNIFVEVSYCENWLDKPVFVNGTICHPRIAEDITKQAEIQLKGIKNEYDGRGEYFPYAKCDVTVFNVDNSGILNAIETRMDLGDGEQIGLKDHLEKCYGGKGNELIDKFDRSLRERGVKDKLYIPDVSEGVVASERGISVDENSLSLEGFNKEIALLRESPENAHSKNAVEQMFGSLLESAKSSVGDNSGRPDNS